MYVHFVAGKEKTKPLDKASSSEKCHVKGCITRPPIIIFRNNRNSCNCHSPTADYVLYIFPRQFDIVSHCIESNNDDNFVIF